MKRVQGEKYIWQIPLGDQALVLEIANKYSLSVPIAQTLVTRGYTTQDVLEKYLLSIAERDVAHPSQMKDAQKAVDRIIKAIEQKEKILIFGDYDVDGITSSALALICLLPLQARVNFFLPHRVKDGYGISTKIIDQAASNGYTLVITVDNGITASQPARRAKERGVDLIITDHHQPHGEVPDAYAIVNPHQADCSYPFKWLAGVGVTFKIMSLLYEQLNRALPQKAYELLLLGTIADVVPLQGENRFWVRHGLRCINAKRSLPLEALLKNSNVQKPQLSSLDIGFSVTPQINALGRLHDPRDGVGFLVGTNEQKVKEIAQVLFELNSARKSIERSIFSAIDMQIASGQIDISKERVILTASNDWPTGVIGLVASRLVSAYNRPVLLFHLTADGKAKGSCRSLGKFNMFDALGKCADLLDQYGGHAHAAGLALKAENLPKLKERLEAEAAQILTDDDLLKKVIVDASVRLSDLNRQFMADMKHLEPFGHKNDQPLFYVEGVSLVQKPTLLKGEHVKCLISAEGIVKPVIFFNSASLFEQLRAHATDTFDLVVQVVENHWAGKVSVELIGVDIAGLKKNI